MLGCREKKKLQTSTNGRNPSTEGREITSIRKDMRWQLLPLTAYEMKKEKCTRFNSQVNNGDTGQG